jgi:DNA-binding IclR family transcriptional regulator
MKSERELQLALGKLLNQVRIQNAWNEKSFMSAAKTAGVSKSEAYRFFKALGEMNLLKRDKQKRRIVPQFNVNIWQNEDRKMMLIRDIMEMFPNIQQKRGRKKPKQFVQQLVEEIHQEVEEQIVTLEQFSSEDLVQELRNRGYEVNCSRTIIETL